VWLHVHQELDTFPGCASMRAHHNRQRRSCVGFVWGARQRVDIADVVDGRSYSHLFGSKSTACAVITD
jgi:hypothetical protein